MLNPRITAPAAGPSAPVPPTPLIDGDLSQTVMAVPTAHSGSFRWPADSPGRLIREAARTACPSTGFSLTAVAS
ncbi:hypothetical protein [Actinoplanes sp. NPDC051411]|uniref:hypothetical protein n=1 Tax=Actinoplanes sp. NPDC051411 TaxID=3155522 RepID=UPI0034430EA7